MKPREMNQQAQDNGLEWSMNLIKPDGISRGLIGTIIKRFEDKGLHLVGLKLVWPSKALVEKSYADNKDEPWFDDLVDYLTSGPVIAMVWEGVNANAAARHIIGKKDPMNSSPGSIRGDYNIEMVRTVVHGSRTPEEAEQEIKLWFFPQSDDPKPVWDTILGTEPLEPDESQDGDSGPEQQGPVMPSKAIHPIDHTREAKG